jgi:hypothetical protein
MAKRAARSNRTNRRARATNEAGTHVQASGSGVAQNANTTGPRSPIFASGANSQNYSQLGDNSSIHIGDYLDQLPPMARDKETHAWGATWGLRVAALVALIANLSTIFGLSLGDLHFTGLWPAIREAFKDGPLVGSAPSVHPAVWFTFIGSAAVLSLWLGLRLQLRRKKYLRTIRGSIYERRHGRPTKSRLSGECPIPHCGSKLKLRKIEVARVPYTVKDSQGNLVPKERSEKGDRLVCTENPDHYFRFDRTNVRDAGPAAA